MDYALTGLEKNKKVLGVLNGVDVKKKYDEKNDIIIYDSNKYNFIKHIKNMYNIHYNYDFNLDDIHILLNTNKISYEDKLYYTIIPDFGVNDRKSIFISIFHKYFDTNQDFRDLYYNFIKDVIKPKFYKDEEFLVVQKTPNIRFHLPNCTNIGRRISDPDVNIIGLHKDYDFGHSENELNFILPLTKMYDTNSIYFESIENSNMDYESYNNLKLNENNIAVLYLNKWKHYNKINVTNKTRVSFDFRIIPYSKYKNNNNKSETSKINLDIDGYFIKL